MKKRNLVRLTVLAAAMALTACSGGKDTANEAGQEQEAGQEKTAQEGADQEKEAEEEAQGEEKDLEAEEPAGMAKANLTIEEVIDNQMRFSGKGYYTMYAKGTTLYAASNAVSDTRSFSRYAELVTEGTAGSQIRQIQTADYSDMELILDSEGRLWYGGKQIFEDYNLQYFDCFFVTSAGYTQNVAAVTKEGTVVYCSAARTGQPPIWLGER